MSFHHHEPEVQQTLAIQAPQSLVEEEHNPEELTEQRQSPVEEGEALLGSLQQEVQRRSLYGRLWLGVFISWALLVLGAYLLHTFTGAAGAFPPKWINVIHLINVTGLIVERSFFRKSVAAKLAQLEEVKFIGPLIDVLGQKGRYTYNVATRKLVAQGLTRLLPRVTAKEAALLKEEQRTFLRNVLKNQGKFGFEERYETDFLVAILEMLARIGDTRCLPHIEELARFAEIERVQKVAAACLPHLHEVAAQEHNRQTLLRAASAEGTSPDHLLRPAQAASDTEPDQLLRAISPFQQ